MGNPVVFLTRTRSVLALVQPVGQTSTVDTQQEHNWAMCCQVNHASSRVSIRKLYFLLESSDLLPSVGAHFHFWKQYFKGQAQSLTQSWQYNSGDRRNWINPVLPNCTNYLVPQKSVISFPTEISALFFSLIGWRHKHLSFNEPIIWRQTKQWTVFTWFGAAATNYPLNEIWMNKTKLC